MIDLRETLKSVRLALIQDVDPDAIIVVIDEALAESEIVATCDHDYYTAGCDPCGWRRAEMGV